VKGSSNVVADALSRLDSTTQPMPTDSHFIANLYGANKQDVMLPITFPNILYHQQKDSTLRQNATSDPSYHFKSFHGGGKPLALICHNNKIAVLTILQRELVTWYHIQLCHPGENRKEQTL
jgi:hypothetical protein